MTSNRPLLYLVDELPLFLLALFRELGVPVAEHRMSGIMAKELMSVGYTPRQLREGGFSPGDLISAGLSTVQLRDAGCTWPDLLAAGVLELD